VATLTLKRSGRISSRSCSSANVTDAIDTMHILVGMIVPGRAGGIHVTESALVNELRRRPGVTVTVFEFGSRTEDESLLDRIVGRMRDLVKYDRLVRSERPDVVYINSAYNERALLRDVGYAVVSRLRNVRLAVKLHGSDAWLVEDKPFFWWTLTKLVFRWSAMVLLLSSEEVERFTAAGFPGGKLRLVKNVVSLERFRRDRVVTENPPGILFIARFIREKGLLDLLRASRIVLDSGRVFKLYCVGDGPVRVQAEALASELGLGDSVEFTGQISEEEATRYYLQCAILVLPTYHQEGFPMTILQAVAAGMPIITTKIRAAADHLAEPANCLWVEPRNPAALAERIRRLLDDPRLQLSMRDNNLALAADFAVETVATEYLRIFSEAGQSRGAVAARSL
jgi:glycosyltransferase involved in cell wall biosynthesis